MAGYEKWVFKLQYIDIMESCYTNKTRVYATCRQIYKFVSIRDYIVDSHAR
jgi:hypothetical protein